MERGLCKVKGQVGEMKGNPPFSSSFPWQRVLCRDISHAAAKSGVKVSKMPGCVGKDIISVQ